MHPQSTDTDFWWSTPLLFGAIIFLGSVGGSRFMADVLSAIFGFPPLHIAFDFLGQRSVQDVVIPGGVLILLTPVLFAYDRAQRRP